MKGSLKFIACIIGLLITCSILVYVVYLIIRYENMKNTIYPDNNCDTIKIRAIYIFDYPLSEEEDSILRTKIFDEYFKEDKK